MDIKIILWITYFLMNLIIIWTLKFAIKIMAFYICENLIVILRPAIIFTI